MENKVKDFFDILFTDNKKLSNGNQGVENEESLYFDKLLKEFYNTDNMRLKSDLKRNQILILTLATVYRDVYGSEIMANIIKYILEYNVSLNRMGRVEFGDIFKFITNQSVDGNDPNASLLQLMGMSKRF